MKETITKSDWLTKPETGKIAVKVINHYGDEVLKVFEMSALFPPPTQKQHGRVNDDGK
jgi:hypothetical protein